ncbi:Rho termination factor [Zhengella mangrovi]|uniref:Rho termination factor n=1 Tax=Zhengella mangrovi TaxID=1982044 RepID=A0A2G1QTP2_9HYPH|nr:Rho termination factor N-terminal domain-containing protein [Zhengella mangrovi]PHP68855.1 Rho termination factor [Zhengella mangrovi]
MPGSKGHSIKDENTYEALRDDGYSKSKAAAIANAQANPSMHPSKKGGKAPPYEDWTREQLYDRAQELGIKGRSGMNKSGLIEALRDRS